MIFQSDELIPFSLLDIEYALFKMIQSVCIMKKVLLLVAFLGLLITSISAQQDPMFTKYMFNSLHFNPAYAGSKDHMSITLLHRDQWWGIQDAPKTQSFTIHSPLNDEKIALGLGVYNDAIGPTNTFNVMTSYAYRLVFNDGSKLSFGLHGGIENWRADFSQLDLQNVTDAAFNDLQPSRWLPNFGIGIYYYNKYWYLGLSAPKLLEWDLVASAGSLPAQTYRHYFLTAGLAFPLSSSIIFKPSFLIKNVGLFGAFNSSNPQQLDINAPTEFDIDLSLLFYEALWIGTSFRSAFEVFDDRSSFDSIDIWAAYYLSNGLRVGASFDYTLTELSTPAQGSFEVMLGYEFNYKEKLIVTPRYF